MEHGSAQWGNVEKDLKDMYDEEDQYNNILFSQNTKIRLDDKNAPFKVRRNKNVLIIGGSGSGKTRFMVKPNMLQMNASFVVTNPKGTIVNEIGMALKNIGKYKIKVFNTVKFNKSMRYNPLAYVYNEQDILKLVNTIIVNTEGEGAKKGEDFWVKAERLLYQAYLSLIVSKFPKEEQHLGTLMDLLSYSTVKENDENYKNPLDYMFEQLEKEDPTHVRFILDEFANIGKIPNFEKLIATIRSRNISATIILQAFAQLKDIYKEKANIIDGNCDTSIFLGSKEKTTIKSLSEELGKETINDYNESKTRSNNDSFGQNYSKLGRALMTQDELLTMERDECIVQILGKKPFKDKKYDITKHPRYKFHSQGEKYWFDINKYLEALRTPREPQENPY